MNRVWVARIILILIVVVAFAARVYQLEVKSLWFEEGMSVHQARRSLLAMFDLIIFEDIHPPLYFLMLFSWIRLVGLGEFAVRFLSVISGVLMVPAVYVLGSVVYRTIDSETPARSPRANLAEGVLSAQMVGLLAAAVVALSPFLISYSQGTRMYSQLALLAVLSSISLWRAQNQSGRRYWVVYAALVAGILYTQYLGIMVPIAHGVYFVLRYRRQRPQMTRYLQSLAVVAALYLVWIPGAYLQLRRLITVPDFWPGELPLDFYLRQIVASFTVGNPWLRLSTENQAILIGLLILFILGLAFGAWRGLRLGGWNDLFLVLAVVVPIVVFYAVAARNPKFAERYMITVAPFFYLILARAVAGLPSIVRTVTKGRAGQTAQLIAERSTLVIGAIVLVVFAQGVPAVYSATEYQKENFRDAAAYISEHEEPGDVIILMLDSYKGFSYYYAGDSPIAGLQPRYDLETGARQLEQITKGHTRLWLLLWSEQWADPTKFVRESLDRAYPLVVEVTEFRHLRLQLYKLQPDLGSLVNFEDTFHLLGYDLAEQSIAAGERIPIVMYWKPTRTMSENLIVSLRLRDDEHYWWRWDGRPAEFDYPTSLWWPGLPVRGHLEMEAPAGMPAGEYQIEVGVYPFETRRDLNILDSMSRRMGTSAIIGKLLVTSPPVPSDIGDLRMKTIFRQRVSDELELLGYSLVTTRVAPGGRVDLSLYWRAIRAPQADYVMRVELTDAAAHSSGVQEGAPVNGRAPTSGWRKGEVLIDKRSVSVSSGAAAGSADLGLRILADGRQIAEVWLGSLEVAGRPVSFDAPEDLQQPVDFRFGDVARLVGYEVSEQPVHAGDEVRLTLFWRAMGSSEVSYTVFTHLLDREQQVRAQHDSPPLGGEALTTGWVAGEYLRDEYHLQLTLDVTAGDYKIEVGLYDPATGQRVEVFGPEGSRIGDRVLLGNVAVGS